MVDEEMKSNDTGAVRRELIKNHHCDKDLQAYMHKRQQSNPGLYRWDSMENESRVAVEISENAEIELRATSSVSGSRGNKYAQLEQARV